MAQNTPVSSALFADFGNLPRAQSYCEVFDSSSNPRDHWKSIVDAFDAMQPATLSQRQERANRMRHDDGTTYNPFDDPSERAITWSLDMIPLPLTAVEWGIIESGILQRATLLEKILGDIYTNQELIKNGTLPAELVYANPNFQRACHNITPPGGRYLTYYAIDIYRSPDGTFKVLRDYADHPSGLGYALENRIVISRVFPDLYHRTQIRRLAPFFQMFHRSMQERAATGRDEPGIVLLSPGPDSRVYFEHALLSRYLGYPLVEGQDLSVRNGQVYQKKLAGLEPVDMIFRHISDDGSDPFTLRHDASTGVTGLLQAVRENSIDIVNPIGSGFVDTPLLSLYLPEVCPSLLNSQLQLENHPAWWFGNPAQQEYILSRFQELHLHPALDTRIEQPPADPEQAIPHLSARPYNWLAHEPLAAGTVPVWENNGLVPHYCLMRFFVCAASEGFRVMPGGLAITANDLYVLEKNYPEEQKSKDIWVLSDQPVEPFSLMSSLHSVSEFRRGNDLPSRVADNLLWLGRYLERSEGQVRLLRSVYRRLSGEAGPEDIPELDFLLGLLLATSVIQIAGEKNDSPDLNSLLSLLQNSLTDKRRPDNPVATLVKVQEVARNVRDRLSLDCWRVINHLEQFIGTAGSDPLDTLDEILFTPFQLQRAGNGKYDQGVGGGVSWTWAEGSSGR